MKNNWLYIAIIAGLVGVALLMWETPPQSLLSPGDDPGGGGPQTYAVIEQAHSRHYDAEGRISYEFVARTLYHFRYDLARVSEGDYTTLDHPQLTLYAGDRLWYLTAERGQVTEFGAVLTLRGQVRIWRPDEDNEVELTTSKLIVRPHAKTAETDVEVKLQSPQGALEAIGMNVDLNTQQIKLNQSVRGYHEPI